KASGFASPEVREFQSRPSTGVRGILLKDGDEVISLSILKGFEASTEEREAYLRAAPWKDNGAEPTLSPERMAEFEAAEEFILTVCANGYGKRSSAYEYRRTGRGGQGIGNIDNLERNGPVVASFPAHNGEQLMLVTDQAKLIRLSVGDTRVIGRNSAGVRLFNVSDNEHVVGAARIEESEEDDEVDLADGEQTIAPDDGAVIGEDLADGTEDGEA
ncbi:MAG: DNA gyrase subunit A, partial [Rhizorhabdus sp.]|uniref:DNA gyrase C-terminal beta-propeller domain-containing protein n=1 Tax=Rhizorhabdus sp. TaxID=1968843 RepID=UPI001B585D1A